MNGPEKKILGEIITFYSFKGGAGRTMALANLAVLTSKLSSRVLVIDWDLEAPGLHKFFYKHISPEHYDNSLGLIELFIEIDKKLSSKKGNIELDDIISCISEINFLKYIIPTKLPGLSLLKAGLFDKIYSERISKFNWLDFFEKAPNFFTEFASYLKNHFDYTFIDSRTGFTDTGGICTTLMPDRLCLIFTTNGQSLDGVSELTQKALSYRVNSLDFRSLKIYPIPSRVELAEKDLREIWRKGKIDEGVIGYQPLFEGIFKAYYGFSDCDLTNYFDIVQIHHEPKYTYGEEIAVISETFSDNLSLTKAYSNILQKVILDNSIYSENIIKANAYSIKVYFSYSQRDAAPVRAIMAALEKDERISVLNSAIGTATDEEAISAISTSNVYVPIVTRNYMSSEFINYELNLLLSNIVTKSGLLIFPIVVDLSSSEVPSLFSKMSYRAYPSLQLDIIKQLIVDLNTAITSHPNFRIAQSRTSLPDLPSLSPREVEFLRLATSDLTYKQIANKMTVSERTVDSYRESLFQKFNVQSRVGLVLSAIKNKIVELD